MRQKWTEEEIWSWYKAQPWITGFNFIPSGAMNGGIWLLQDYDHERAYRESAKEIALAASLGFNSIRFFVPFYLWRVQHDSFMKILKSFYLFWICII